METKQKDASVDMESRRIDTTHPMYGRRHTEETKRLIGTKAKERLANPENHPLYGVPMSEETKLRISEANSGRKHSDESKSKMSKSRTGLVQSKPHRAAIAAGRTFKRFEVVDPDGNVKVVDNLHRYSIDNELHISSMYRVARGDRSHHRGYKVKELLNE